MAIRITSARTYWRNTPRLVRVWTIALVPLGVLLLGVGVLGDEYGYWEGKSFLTNLVSSFTSLMFGVPVALHVLSHLADAQATATARRQWFTREAREREALEAHLLALTPGRTVAEIRASARSWSALAARLSGSRPVPSQEIRGVFQELRAYQGSIAESDSMLGGAIYDDTMWADTLKHQVRSYTRVRDAGDDFGVIWSTPWPMYARLLETLEVPAAEVLKTYIFGHFYPLSNVTAEEIERARQALRDWLQAVPMLVGRRLPEPSR